jgi:mannitol/fructose-specific phosphotransferase system IIA component (Ntr-type)
VNVITSESLIELHLRSTNKTEIIENLAIRAKKAGRISDINGYMQAVSEVEKRHSTVLGYGIAIPYGKSSCVQSPFIAFARSDETFRWDIRTDLGTKFVFLIGVPEDQNIDLDLKLLSNMCGGMKNISKREKLLKANSATEVMTIFKEMGL